MRWANYGYDPYNHNPYFRDKYELTVQFNPSEFLDIGPLEKIKDSQMVKKLRDSIIERAITACIAQMEQQ